MDFTAYGGVYPNLRMALFSQERLIPRRTVFRQKQSEIATLFNPTTHIFQLK